MIFTVQMIANYDKGKVREVDVPDQMAESASDDELLQSIFKYGQNDFQPQQVYSVSVGDVINLRDELWIVAPLGFKQITQEQFDKLPGNLTQHHDLYWNFLYNDKELPNA